MGLLEHQDRIKKDIQVAIDVWKEFLNEMGELVEYAYVKGSAFKKWASDIDYIPYVSDVDIHVKIIDDDRITPLTPESFGAAYSLTEQYENRFKNKSKQDYYHIPRIQLVQLNLHGGKGYNVPPREQDVKPIISPVKFKPELAPKKVKIIDMRNVLVERDFIDSFPEKLFFLSMYDYIPLLHKISGKVSPFPVRLLNQFVRENPHEVWNWNRTRVVDELHKLGFEMLAEHYRKYYNLGWRAQESHFQDTNIVRELLKYGYSVLFETYLEMYKLKR